MKGRIAKFYFWSYKPSARLSLLIIQFICAFLGTYATTSYTGHKIAFIVFLCLIILIILWSIFVLVLSRLYNTIVLFCNIDTGCLYDKITGMVNVSLRASSILTIFDCLIYQYNFNENDIKNIGYKIGQNFVKDYRSYMRKFHSDFHSNSNAVIANLFSYDSSSGMGKFTLNECSGSPSNFAKVHIKNPFTNRNGSSQKLCYFLVGYIEGLFNNVYFDRTLTATVESVDFDNLNILIKESQQ